MFPVNNTGHVCICVYEQAEQTGLVKGRQNSKHADGFADALLLATMKIKTGAEELMPQNNIWSWEWEKESFSTMYEKMEDV